MKTVYIALFGLLFTAACAGVDWTSPAAAPGEARDARHAPHGDPD
ncbi:MAG: hypothetical protein AAGK98_09420 [Pseudomonadota bacterium]